MKNNGNPVVVRNLSYRYSDGTSALEDVSFDISNGDSVALVGPNGAGKSTLLLHLNGILSKQDGSIEILGMPLERRNVGSIRKRVGLVFQDPEDQLFMSTVFDDIAFGPINMGLPEEQVRERVRWALTEVGLNGYEDRCPHHLSLGEKKKVSVATVLSMGPEIILLDEPTSNLDPLARRRMIEMLKGLRATKLIASHDIEMLLGICDRGILLDNGRVVADGKTADVLTDPELLREHCLEVPMLVKLFGSDALDVIREDF
ncbi:MAG: ABC transporter ATP-binding protein [Thermoplasmata archaeon]